LHLLRQAPQQRNSRQQEVNAFQRVIFISYRGGGQQNPILEDDTLGGINGIKKIQLCKESSHALFEEESNHVSRFHSFYVSLF